VCGWPAGRGRCGAAYSAKRCTLLLYLICEVIEHGRAAGLLAQVPGQFRPARRRHRVTDDPNEDELGKALPESVIRQLDDNLPLLGPAGGAGFITAEDLQRMHQTIYQLLRDTGRRPGEVVSLHIDCLEVIDGQHNLIYDNHKAARMRRRLPITTQTARVVMASQHHRALLPAPPALRDWLFPSPQLRAKQGHGHLTTDSVGRAFSTWVSRIDRIDGELRGPDGRPAPFDRSHVTPYALRHSYAQRHADGGVPVVMLKELMDHVAVATRWATTGSASNAYNRPSALSDRWPPTPTETPPRSPVPLPANGRRCPSRSATFGGRQLVAQTPGYPAASDQLPAVLPSTVSESVDPGGDAMPGRRGRRWSGQRRPGWCPYRGRTGCIQDRLCGPR
jgi:integrase